MSLPFLARRPEFDRERILADAARARARRKRQKAIALYRWVLAVEPRNPEHHLKLAPLLAETGQSFDAWMSYQSAAQAYVHQGLVDKGIGVYREAARSLPREYKAWQAIARLQLKAGREDEAVDTLLEGSRQFRGRYTFPQAIYLLRRAREVEPWDFEACLELARLLSATDQLREAELLLRSLALRESGVRLRRVRGVEFLARPSPARLWRWLHAALQAAGDPAAQRNLPASRGRGRVTVLRPNQVVGGR